jgi:hypothetical protein
MRIDNPFVENVNQTIQFDDTFIINTDADLKYVASQGSSLSTWNSGRLSTQGNLGGSPNVSTNGRIYNSDASQIDVSSWVPSGGLGSYQISRSGVRADGGGDFPISAEVVVNSFDFYVVKGGLYEDPQSYSNRDYLHFDLNYTIDLEGDGDYSAFYINITLPSWFQMNTGFPMGTSVSTESYNVSALLYQDDIISSLIFANPDNPTGSIRNYITFENPIVNSNFLGNRSQYYSIQLSVDVVGDLTL